MYGGAGRRHHFSWPGASSGRRPGAGKFRARLCQFRLWLPRLSARHVALRPRAVHRRFSHVGWWQNMGTGGGTGRLVCRHGLAPGASVSQVVFAGPSDGWAYGNSLWATYDGAHTWQQVDLDGPVLSLNSSAHFAYALVGNCSPGAANCQGPALRLERSVVGSEKWAPVPGISGYGTSAIIAVNGANAWVSMVPRDHGAAMIWTTADGGAKWHSLPDSCYQPAQATDLAGLASPGGRVVFELCAGNPGAGQEGKSLRISSDGGSTSRLVGYLPLGGLAQGIAAAGHDNVYVTAVSGASDVYSSDNGGRTWDARIFDDGGAGLTDIGFSTPSFGAAIEGQPADGPVADRLLVTDDGGATWSVVKS